MRDRKKWRALPPAGQYRLAPSHLRWTGQFRQARWCPEYFIGAADGGGVRVEDPPLHHWRAAVDRDSRSPPEVVSDCQEYELAREEGFISFDHAGRAEADNGRVLLLRHFGRSRSSASALEGKAAELNLTPGTQLPHMMITTARAHYPASRQRVNSWGRGRERTLELELNKWAKVRRRDQGKTPVLKRRGCRSLRAARDQW